MTYGPNNQKHLWPLTYSASSPSNYEGLRFQNVGTLAQPKPRISLTQARLLNLPLGFPNEYSPAQFTQSSSKNHSPVKHTSGSSSSGSSAFKSEPIRPKYRELTELKRSSAPSSSDSVHVQEQPFHANYARNADQELTADLPKHPKKPRTAVVAVGADDHLLGQHVPQSGPGTSSAHSGSRSPTRSRESDSTHS